MKEKRIIPREELIQILLREYLLTEGKEDPKFSEFWNLVYNRDSFMDIWSKMLKCKPSEIPEFVTESEALLLDKAIRNYSDKILKIFLDSQFQKINKLNPDESIIQIANLKRLFKKVHSESNYLYGKIPESELYYKYTDEQLNSELEFHKEKLNLTPPKKELLEIESEKILWRGTKQDLVAFYDILIDFGLIALVKNKDQLLNKHFGIINDKNKIGEVGELKHTRKLLKDSAKPSDKMQIIIDAIEKAFSVDNK